MPLELPETLQSMEPAPPPAHSSRSKALMTTADSAEGVKRMEMVGTPLKSSWATAPRPFQPV